eukprot:m.193300 g.193300  ORF g.193300 m.193300 type:complete len:431 (+) comp16779_c6_seq3:171-1463(+)
MYFNTYHALNFASKSRQVVNKPFEAVTTTAVSLRNGVALSGNPARGRTQKDHAADGKGQPQQQPTTQCGKSSNTGVARAEASREQLKHTLAQRQTGVIARPSAKADSSATTRKLEQRVQQLEEYMTDIMLKKMTEQNQQAMTKPCFAETMSEEQRIHVAKSIIQVAKAFKSSGDLPSALRHYEEAHELLPNHEGLKAKVEALRIKVAARSQDPKTASKSNQEQALRPASNVQTEVVAAMEASKRVAFSSSLALPKGKNTKLKVFDEFGSPHRVASTISTSTAPKRSKLTEQTNTAAKPSAKRKPLRPIQASTSGKQTADALNDSAEEDPTWQPEEECDSEEDAAHSRSSGEQKKKRAKLQEVPASLYELLNRADAKLLMELNGIGKKRAQAILMQRQALGSFSTINDLHECGLSDGLLSRLVLHHTSFAI